MYRHWEVQEMKQTNKKQTLLDTMEVNTILKVTRRHPEPKGLYKNDSSLYRLLKRTTKIE